MKEVLSSKATVDVSVADIGKGYRLFCAIVQAFKRNGLDITVPKKLSLEDLLKDNAKEFINGFLDVITSQQVMDLIFDCGASAIYTKNGHSHKVTWETFEEEENREDFFEVLKVVAWRNIKPFFPKALMK